MTKLLYTVATKKDGQFIQAIDAEKGNDFYCPICKEKLILRKSGNTGKGSKRPHFAHNNLTPNCTPESALHFSFKNLLFKEIDGKINLKLPINISWHCKYCNDNHKGNLLKKVTSVKLEHNLKVCQPDLTLLDNDNKTIAVFEVVVTHKPEQEVLNYYKENNIILIQINLTSHKDIELLEEKISNPDLVDICFNPKCKTCGNYKLKSQMKIIDGECWRCKNTMKIASTFKSYMNSSPKYFSNQEIEFARSKGVLLKVHYSSTMECKYLANTCRNCGSFVGDFHIISEYITPAEYGEIPSESYDIGFHCQHCDILLLKN